MNQPDAIVDRTLQSLRDTQAPTGLESRVAARLAQAAESTIKSSRLTDTSSRVAFFTGILTLSLPKVKNPRILLAQATLYPLTAAFLAASLLVFHNHHQSTTTIAHTNPQPLPTPTRPFQPSNQSSLATTRVPQGFNLGSHRIRERTGFSSPASTDPDTLALAETLAPSHPAAPMPLTAQEHLLLLATRQGQPIEVAELDIARQPALQAAAEAQQQATIRNYIHSLLGPLAAAEAMNPTPLPGDTSPSQLPSSR